jgi:hypothetical protein
VEIAAASRSMALITGIYVEKRKGGGIAPAASRLIV